MVIFSPGPANISERVRRALLKPDISHRDTEFSDLLNGARANLMDILGVRDGYESVFLGGSGTAAIESVIAAFGGYDKEILVVSNGIYGERAADIARVCNIKIEEMKCKWGSLPDLGHIRSKLRQARFGAVYIVHHETTTGLVNPLKEISLVAKKYKRLVLTDAISSIASENIDIKGWGIDVVIGSVNKCIRAVPGISFAVASKRFLKTIEDCTSHSFYTNLSRHLDTERGGQTPFTPPVQAFYAFDEALKELKSEGVHNRIKKYRDTTGYLRRGLKKLGMRFFLPGRLMSNTMTAVYMPKGKSYPWLHDEFKKRGFVIYASPGELKDTTFRLGTVGVISKKDINMFLAIFKKLL
ncbi:MAG: alanine--glyoxylate aminotransferase family protein [Candidatus Omnitrophota bacterium]